MILLTKVRKISEGSESRRCTLQMRIWEKILCSWACAAYCQNCEPNSHAVRAQTVVLRSDAMRAHSRIFNKCLFCNAHRRFSTLLTIKNVGANQ